jgi:hypothetical protein
VPEAVAGKTVRLAVVELGDSASVPTGPRYRIVIGGCLGSCEQVTVACETFADAGLHNLADGAPKWDIALVLCLCGFQSNEVLAPMKLIETQPQDLIQRPPVCRSNRTASAASRPSAKRSALREPNL